MSLSSTEQSKNIRYDGKVNSKIVFKKSTYSTTQSTKEKIEAHSINRVIDHIDWCLQSNFDTDIILLAREFMRERA